MFFVKIWNLHQLLTMYVAILIERILLHGLKFSKTKNFSGLLDFPRESNFHDKIFMAMLFMSCVLYLMNMCTVNGLQWLYE